MLLSERGLSSTTKSGQIGENCSSLSSSVRAFQRSFKIHAASGERVAPLGSLKPAEESNPVPRASAIAQTTSWAVSRAFLAPVPHRGKTNEPAYVVHTAAALARIRGITEAEVASATTDNFFRLYTKARRPAAQESAAE